MYIKRITHFETKDAEESKRNNPDLKTIRFKVDGGKENMKVHVFASNTIFSNFHYMAVNQFNSTLYRGSQRYVFKHFENEYMNNKKLGDELRYALERKYLKSFIGTTLDRPSLLYNRKYFCDTNFTTESGQLDQGYQRFQKIQQRAQNFGYAFGKIEKKSKMKTVGGYGSLQYYSYSIESYSYDSSYQSFLNF